MDFSHYFHEYPDRNGFFGPYGGAELAPELIEAFKEINDAYQAICQSSKFINELRRIRKEFQGRPTPLYHCDRLSRKIGNCQIYIKREESRGGVWWQDCGCEGHGGEVYHLMRCSLRPAAREG